MIKTQFFTLLVALVAALCLSSTAMAKGGGGGGGEGTSCARILDFGQPLTYDANGQPLLQTTFTVFNGCVDHETTGRVALDYSNSVSGFTGRSFWGFGYGTFSWSSTAGTVTPGVTYTVTLTVYLPNGKIGDQRTLSTTVPAAVAPAA